MKIYEDLVHTKELKVTLQKLIDSGFDIVSIVPAKFYVSEVSGPTAVSHFLVVFGASE